MSEEDADSFDASYQRGKRIVKRLNEYARDKYLAVLKEEENADPASIVNYEAYLSAKMAERKVWRDVQEITRTR